MQKTSSRWLKSRSFPMMIGLLITAYFLLLTLRIPPAALAFFHQFSIPLFFLVLASFFLVFRLPGRTGWAAGFGLTLLFFGLALSYLWTSGFTNNGILGGLLPYKDGRFYYWSSQMLLNSERISIHGNQGYERPLFPGFMSFFLLVTQSNLKWSLAVIVALAAASAYMATRGVFERWGALPASVFMTFLYIYIGPLLGFNNSELPGFIFGCLGFALLFRASLTCKFTDLILGLISTMLAVSARAGAFFIFPALILWAGWAYRKENRFSFKVAGVITGIVAAAFLVFNLIYPKLVVEPGGVTFGNFAFMFYGQVRGGAGWTEGFRVTGTKDPEVIMRAALDFFRRHPFSLVIGSLKAYRDFFFPVPGNILPFMAKLNPAGILDLGIWVGSTSLLVSGLVRAFRERSRPVNLMLLAGFAGIFLSIPLLPPVDGGSRFYAGTMAFYFAPFALGVKSKYRGEAVPDTTADRPHRTLRILCLLLVSLTLLTPISLRLLRDPLEITTPECTVDQKPFALKVNSGAYIDLIPESTQPCNLIPNVCFSDFQVNSEDKTTDDFYQELVAQTQALNTVTRIVPYHNFIDRSFHYYLGTADKLPLNAPDHLVTGCATEIRTEHQSIYKVESIRLP